MSDVAFLEIIFHMTNGHELKFYEYDEAKAQEILSNVRPSEFFTEKQFAISSKSSATRIVIDFVSCVVFNTSTQIEWSFPSHIEGAFILSKEKFTEAIDSELENSEVVMEPGQRARPLSLFLKLLMKDGNIWNLRFFAETLKPVERAELAKIIHELTGFHAVKPEGGAVLFNMKNVISWTTYPTALLASQKTWELKNNSNEGKN